ncbi:MAG: homoserine kinase [Bacteroidota bacterium]
MAEVVEVRVPASTANLGPGFDAVGMALELFNVVRIGTTTTTGLEITVLGDSKDLPLDWTNLVARSAAALFEKVGVPVPGLRIHVQQRIPVSRGLGSSAAAIVAGLLGANALAGLPLGDDEMLQLATEIEGHPDNVAAALFGGFVVSVRGFGSEAVTPGADSRATGAGLPSVGSVVSIGSVGSGGSGSGALHAARDAAIKASAQAGAGATCTAGAPSARGCPGECLRYLKLDAPRSLYAVIAIPDFQVPTELARRVLPASVPLADAVHNISRTALLVASIASGRLELLADAMEDRLHQPYRADLTPGLTDVLAAARKEGALGAALSGSGPSVLAFASRDPRAVAEAMAAAFAARGVTCRTVITRASSRGATVHMDPRVVAKEQTSRRAGAFETR